jgi:hypothetical protein
MVTATSPSANTFTNGFAAFTNPSRSCLIIGMASGPQIVAIGTQSEMNACKRDYRKTFGQGVKAEIAGFVG